MADKFSNSEFFNSGKNEVADGDMANQDINLYEDSGDIHVKFKDTGGGVNDIVVGAGVPNGYLSFGSELFSQGASFPGGSIASADVHSLPYSSGEDALMKIVMPGDYTSSTDLTLNAYWYASLDTGNVEWTLYWGRIEPNGAIPFTPDGSQVVTDTVPATTFLRATSTFTIPGSTLTLDPGDVLNLKFERSGGTLATVCNFIGYGIIYDRG